MKKLSFVLIFAAFFCLQSCWIRLGDLNMVSNRNIDSNTEYVELQRYVVSKATRIKAGNGSLELAVDKAVQSVPGGEFLKNVRIDVKANGKKLRVHGDVWGIKLPSDTIR